MAIMLSHATERSLLLVDEFVSDWSFDILLLCLCTFLPCLALLVYLRPSLPDAMADMCLNLYSPVAV